MKAVDRARLTAALRDHAGKIAADLRAQMRTVGGVRERARKLHRDEQVGDDFDVWTDLLSRRAAVLWVLKSVYVRVLEDRGLLSPGRLLDREAQHLFEQLAPNLGETAFLRWVYRDLASRDGGLPELFSPQPAEVALPADALSRALIDFWRHEDADTGACWSFADERFEGELMGDLYQDLDPVVKDRFALCQTPDFVREFILDRTLTPAIDEFGADTVRLLDPTCGSGHFLIDGLKRLVKATQSWHPDWSRGEVVKHCLNRVVGIDLNDYACALARARLIMTASELAGSTTLAESARWHPHVYWADGLEQVEKSAPTVTEQLMLEEVEVPLEPETAKARATLTRPEVREALRIVLAPKFHAVVGNPPYITEKDPARKAYHREKIGATQRYVSAYREYSLASPFTERCFQLAAASGFLGLITSNNFMKREFGKALIEHVLSQKDLTMVVDTSQAHIPNHGTATVSFFARNRRPVGDRVHAVMGKRGESVRPADPKLGKVWVSIAEGWGTVGFENEFVSVATLPRQTLHKHPWSLGGGGKAELKQVLEAQCAQQCLQDAGVDVGFVAITRADDVYLVHEGALRRAGIDTAFIVQNIVGDTLRNWQIVASSPCLFPYESQLSPVDPEGPGKAVLRFLWPYREQLWRRREHQGDHRELGMTWYEWSRFIRYRFQNPLSIAFAFVATHNHFVLDRGGKVFNRSAPVIKLPGNATLDDHFALLGLLNASTACFWMKQVFHCKGAQGIGRGSMTELWEQFYEHDSTKIKEFPLPANYTRVIPWATALDALATERSTKSYEAVLSGVTSWTNAPSLRAALDRRRTDDLQRLHHMVARQEELDWLCYELYGLLDDGCVVAPDEVDPHPPTWLPYLLNLAEKDAELRDALARGEDPGETPTAWFERHRWDPVRVLPDDVPPALRARIEKRRAIIESNPSVRLIETATFKRRWYKPDYEAEEKAALETWLADAVEAVAETRTAAFTLEQLCGALLDNPRVLAVAEVLTGRPDFDLAGLVKKALDRESVPLHPSHVYKDTGLAKRAAWEKTWDDQRREDAGEKVTPEVPPSYTSADFLRNEQWQLRGKLDVPKERFIAFTEIPGRGGDDTLYGWAGWTPLQRLKALLAVDEDLEDQGVPLPDRVGLLDSAWRLLPWIAQDDPAAANRLKAELQAVVGETGPSPEMLADWRRRFPPPGSRPKKTKAAG